MLGRQLKPAQRVHISAIQSSYIPESEDLHFQLTASLQAGITAIFSCEQLNI